MGGQKRGGLPFFVYGTLRPGGFFHGQIEYAVERSAPAAIPGYRLYVSKLPYIAPNPTAPGLPVQGELLWVRAEFSRQVTRALDRLESYNPPHDMMYVRAAVTTYDLQARRYVKAWVYLGGPRFAYEPDLIVRSGSIWKLNPQEATQAREPA